MCVNDRKLWHSEVYTNNLVPSQAQVLNSGDLIGGDFCLQGTAGVGPHPLGPCLLLQLQPPTTSYPSRGVWSSVVMPQAPGILSGLHSHSYLATVTYPHSVFSSSVAYNGIWGFQSLKTCHHGPLCRPGDPEPPPVVLQGHITEPFSPPFSLPTHP